MKLIFSLLLLLGVSQGVNAQTEPIDKGFPVISHRDTLFHIKNKLGSLPATERAQRSSEKIERLAEDLLFLPDSVKIKSDTVVTDVAYKGDILISLSNADAGSVGMDRKVLAQTYRQIIIKNVEQYKKETDLTELLKRAAMGLLILFLLILCIFYLNKYFNRFTAWLGIKVKDKLGNIKIKDYELINRENELLLINRVLGLLKLFLIVMLVYVALPLIFQLFPWTKPWSDRLISFVLVPLKSMFGAIVNFIPNFIKILVIFFVFRYLKKGIRFLSHEIETEKLKITGFYPDWAKPTYNIVRIVLDAFMLVVIWPSIPGSDSDIFKGVSVFLGLLISFGSSSAISNGVAGMVITYMRPFAIGDTVKIGDVEGDVLEKSLLVTRLVTVKNEIVTIPNSAILNGNTINYSSLSKKGGLVLHSKITLGYDIPWQTIHKLLIEAALATEDIIKEKQPYVFQKSLDDWYVTYQINAYTSKPEKMGRIYSELHKNIHDAFDAAGVEIMSPHYRAIRDGNESTIGKGE
ncbi:mechanosensitive ion channel family protein [Pedobacter sp. KR3-3]|uniref:Mechanosensitive ion channel family protein n=1 Tax=Pedobacter albus TaxID=3113905 RepID=A0ABU7I2T9_9SPHI|nr:mechanosensitive ion channel family protein [Pedobacter sp. KR3-3]MEE1943771.1 mechanosensitive ion channel family protein [Pedobacter sp. KR3-3]